MQSLLVESRQSSRRVEDPEDDHEAHFEGLHQGQVGSLELEAGGLEDEHEGETQVAQHREERLHVDAHLRYHFTDVFGQPECLEVSQSTDPRANQVEQFGKSKYDFDELSDDVEESSIRSAVVKLVEGVAQIFFEVVAAHLQDFI